MDNNNGEQVNYADFADDAPGEDISGVADETTNNDANQSVTENDIEGDEGEQQDAKDEADENDDPGLEDDEFAEKDDDKLAADEAIEIADGVKLTKAEIAELHAKKEDYSRYSDELRIVSTERETLTKMNEQVYQATTRLQGEFKVLEQFLHSQIPDRPDPALLATDPGSYALRLQIREDAIAKYNQFKAQSDQALAAAMTNADKLNADQTAARTNAEVAKLLTAVPALRNEKKAAAYLNSLEEFGKRYGFTGPEIRETVARDHRVALIMRKAALYDAKVASSKPIPVKPKSQTIPATARVQSPSKGALDRRSLNAALDRAGSPNGSRPQSLREIGKFFDE